MAGAYPEYLVTLYQDLVFSLAASLIGSLSGCAVAPDAPASRNALHPAGSGGHPGDGPDLADDGIVVDDATSTAGQAGQATPEASPPPDEEPEAAHGNFPTFYYHGGGTITASTKGTKSLRQSITVRLSAQQASIDLTESDSPDGGGDVNKGLAKNRGLRTFRRAPLNPHANFLIMVDQSAKGGVTTTYSPAIPALIFPAMSPGRYAALKGGAALTFATTATANGRAFPVTVAVKTVGACLTTCQISIASVAVGDTNGQLYDLMGLPATITFNVDFATSRISRLSTTGYFHVDKLGGPGGVNPADMVLAGSGPGALLQRLAAGNPKLAGQLQKMSSKQTVAADLSLCMVETDGKKESLGACQ